jgi:glycine/D-amino acid oxidase-like deaminating enzyme
MKFDSYWLDTAPGCQSLSQGPVEGRADVVVIGAGFTGLSAALALSRRGASVVVLEAGRIGGGASGRNGGHCNTGVAQDYLALSRQWGRERASACYRAYAAAVETVERLIREEHIDCDYRAAGKLKLASKAKHLAHLEATAECIRREVDPDVELFDATAIRREVDSDQFFGGMLQRRGGQMHMGRFAIGLAHAAAARGARLYENAAVSGLQRLHGDAFRVSSARGEIEAAQVLVATGPSRHGPFQWFRRRLAPIGSFIIVTEPLPAEVMARLLPNRRTYVTSRLMHHYFRTLPDNRLMLGGRARFTASERASDPRSCAILRRNLGQIFPGLAATRIDYCWGGLVDMTADRMPRAGQHDGLYYAMGYSGHGTQMATHMGQMMADVMNGTPQHNPWREFDWPAIPGHTGKPWFLPLVGTYFKVKDLFY